MVVDKFIKKYSLCFILIFSVVLYLKIFLGFFQQDEWYGYGWFVLHKNLNLLDSLKFFFYPSLSHYNPLTVGIQQILFSLWGLNYTNFAILGLILHSLVVLSFFILARKIFPQKNQALWATIIFATFAAGFQAVTWVVTDIATLTASLLGLLSCSLFFDFLRKEKMNKLILSLLLLLISLFFKEIALGLLPLYLGVYIVNKDKKFQKRPIFILISFSIVYLISRILMVFVPQVYPDGVVTQYLSISKIIYNLVTLPIKNITYIFIQPDFFKSLWMSAGVIFPSHLRGTFGSPFYEEFVVKTLMETGSLIIGLSILIIGLIAGIKSKNKNSKFTILFGISWTVLNSFIFALSPGATETTLIPDSRNLYFVSIGIAIALANFNKRKVFLSLFILINIIWLNSNITNFIIPAQTRKNILNQIKRDYPILPSKVIFYAESDSSFYGLPDNEHIMPFQSGFGQTLLSWYEESQNFPVAFFKNNYLWDIKSQGYKEIGGYGFGYFRDFNLLKNAIIQNKFNVDNVIGYSYNSKNQLLTNITKDLDKKLVNYETK